MVAGGVMVVVIANLIAGVKAGNGEEELARGEDDEQESGVDWQ